MSDKAIYVICCIIWGAFAFLFVNYGYISEQPCDLDKVNLWCHLHPGGPLATIGQIFFWTSFVFVTGVWKFFTGEIITNKALAYAGIGFLCGVVGIALIWAN